MVGLAVQIALESDRVTLEVFEAAEFPHLSQKYAVMAVPKTVINEQTWIEGAVPENVFLDSIRKGLRKAAS